MPRLLSHFTGLLLVASGLVLPAVAQNAHEPSPVGGLAPPIGTIYANAQPQFADGKLSACLVEFQLVYRDWAYNRGDYTLVIGSFGIMNVQERRGGFFESWFATLRYSCKCVSTE
jgi:hypothetical protein